MKVKNTTPFPFGPKLTARRPPQREMAVIVRGAFALRPGAPLAPFPNLLEQRPLTAEGFVEGDDERTGEAVYPGDFADWKPRADLLLRGTAHAPEGKPVRELGVRFAVGAWSKSLRVVGPRFWSDGLLQSSTEPVPFTRMPLDFAHAFGGPGYARNPSGKGVTTLELPNVELPGEPVRSRRDKVTPASFGPLSSTWPDRAGKVGREYGPAWKKTRAPFYAEDFDFGHFNAAPPDQQLEGYLRGDEEVTFQNLHEGAQVFSVRLPALRLRAFVKDDKGEVREARMNLDTLFADMDDGRLLLTWRGLVPVREDDLADVAVVFIASEPLADAPLPEAHYRARIEAFEADPLGVEDYLDAHVAPHLHEPARKALRGESPGMKKPAEGQTPAESLGATLRDLPGVGEERAAEIQRGVEDAIQRAEPHADVSQKLGEGMKAAAEPTRGAPAAPGVGAPPSVPLAEPLAAIAAQIADAKKHGVQNPGFDRLEALLKDPRLRQIDPQIQVPGAPSPEPPPEPGPGVDCSGRDLSKRDLSNRDLSGAIFRGAILAGASLYKANLTGASLDGCNLAGADLEGANLTGADLRRANLSKANARGAVFQGAKLEEAVLRKADLTGAVLDEARADMMKIDEANLTRAKLRRLHFRKVIFEKCELEGADLEGAELSECHFVACHAKGLHAKGALLPKSTFTSCDLNGASFNGARGDRSAFSGCKIDGASFELTVLRWSHWPNVTGTGARFFGANLEGARFYRAELLRPNFERSNLFSADLCKSHLTSGRFVDANLYDAKLLGTAGAGNDFSGANLKRALFDPT